jgi:hypothetical protein
MSAPPANMMRFGFHRRSSSSLSMSSLLRNMAGGSRRIMTEMRLSSNWSTLGDALKEHHELAVISKCEDYRSVDRHMSPSLQFRAGIRKSR